MKRYRDHAKTRQVIRRSSSEQNCTLALKAEPGDMSFYTMSSLLTQQKSFIQQTTALIPMFSGLRIINGTMLSKMFATVYAIAIMRLFRVTTVVVTYWQAQQLFQLFLCLLLCYKTTFDIKKRQFHSLHYGNGFDFVIARILNNQVLLRNILLLIFFVDVIFKT